VNTPVYVETRFIIDSYIGCNNTPRIENIPLFAGSVSGEKYIQDFSIIDSDSDSVSFEYVVPKYDDNANALNYRLPFQYNISENQDISQLAFDRNQCSMMFNTATGDNRYCMDFEYSNGEKRTDNGTTSAVRWLTLTFIWKIPKTIARTLQV
jgi:hypothetical protein